MAHRFSFWKQKKQISGYLHQPNWTSAPGICLGFRFIYLKDSKEYSTCTQNSNHRKYFYKSTCETNEWDYMDHIFWSINEEALLILSNDSDVQKILCQMDGHFCTAKPASIFVPWQNILRTIKLYVIHKDERIKK